MGLEITHAVQQRGRGESEDLCQLEKAGNGQRGFAPFQSLDQLVGHLEMLRDLALGQVQPRAVLAKDPPQPLLILKFARASLAHVPETGSMAIFSEVHL